MDSLTALEAEKTKAVLGDDFPTAIHLRTQEEKLKKQLAEIEKQIETENTVPLRDIVAEDIAHTVSLMTKIPLTKLTETESEKLLNLEKILKNHIIGQDEAVSDLAKTIRRSRAGIAHSQRPIGSFVFLGPTGVGKTETAKVIAQELFGDADNLIRVDMSEFMERHNVSRLIGAPAGYVGYEEGGKLTEAVRRKPYAVVLFDEMEKAHPDVFNILLQVLDEGRLKDSKGRYVNFRNCIIVLTSNIGSQFITKMESFGFSSKPESDYSDMKDKVMDSLKDFFRPEFLNRLDEIIVFDVLSREMIQKIVEIQLQQLVERLRTKNVILRYTSEASAKIAELGYDPHYGARPIKRVIQKEVLNPVALAIVSNMDKKEKVVVLDVKNGQLTLDLKGLKSTYPKESTESRLQKNKNEIQ
jgi:ATP-dependent Clp protease ATP-binding subunit ClpC